MLMKLKQKKKKKYLLDKKINCATDMLKFYTACQFLPVNK